MKDKLHTIHHYPEVGIPFFWPLSLAFSMEKPFMELGEKNLKFLEEVEKTEIVRPKPEWASPNSILYALHTLILRDFSDAHQEKNSIPTVIMPPYSGHTSIIADFHKDQSLVETLLTHGVHKIIVIDWQSATLEMKNYDIDNYLADIHIVVSDLGGCVNFIGLSQGGWMASLYAARYPKNVNSLVLAGAPIDTQAGDGPIKEYVNSLPLSFFENLVRSGGGLLRGAYMLEGFKSLNPDKEFIGKYVDLYDHIDDPSFVKRTENFERWYEYTLNLPGRWYMQVIRDLFKENLFIKEQFMGLGKRLNAKEIVCPLYLLAGDHDDVTPKEQVFAAESYYGTKSEKIQKDMSKSGHVGLFMGISTLTENWPKVASWLLKQEK
jgi:poly(3-hydroxyalkanoate) synthetase